MNRNLEQAVIDLRKVDALMLAYEITYLDLDPAEEDYELIDKRNYAFLAIQDAIALVADDLDRLASDVRIVEVVQAIAMKNTQ